MITIQFSDVLELTGDNPKYWCDYYAKLMRKIDKDILNDPYITGVEVYSKDYGVEYPEDVVKAVLMKFYRKHQGILYNTQSYRTTLSKTQFKSLNLPDYHNFNYCDALADTIKRMLADDPELTRAELSDKLPGVDSEAVSAILSLLYIRVRRVIKPEQFGGKTYGGFVVPSSCSKRETKVYAKHGVVSKRFYTPKHKLNKLNLDALLAQGQIEE